MILRRTLVWMASAALALAAAGCGGDLAPLAEPDPLAHRLRSLKDTYYEYEPLKLVLFTVNDTPKTHYLGIQDVGGYFVIHELADENSSAWRQVPAEQNVADQQLLPGESVVLRLDDLTGQAVLTRPGTWVVSYRYFQEVGSRRKFQFESTEVQLRCVSQPLNLPEGTAPDVAAALKALAAAPAHDYVSRYPSWTKVNDSEPMRRLRELGGRAVPALLANLGNYRIRPAVIEVLADLKCRPAVPPLLALLKMNDSVQDRLILSALAAITGLPKGLDYYTYWDRIETKEEALGAYRAWYAQAP